MGVKSYNLDNTKHNYPEDPEDNVLCVRVDG